MSLPTGLVVDGITYQNVHIVSLKRNADILDGSNAERAKSGLMIRDIIGTFYNYTCEVESDAAHYAEYDSLYEVLSAPDDCHLLILPYGQDSIQFTAYVSKVSDELSDISNSVAHWKGMSFQFVAMQPQRRP